MSFLSGLFEKRSSLDSVSGNGWFNLLLGDNQSHTGVNVTEFTAMQQSTVYTCVRILSEGVASLPLHTYKRLQRGKERAYDHPLYYVLHDIANEEMTAFSLFETMMHHLLLWGNAYAEVVRNGRGEVVEIYPLMPNTTYLERNQRDKKLYYRTIIPQTNEHVILPASKVLHISGLGFDGRQGYSVIQMAREAVGMALATEEYGARFFGNGAKPSGILEHPNSLSEPAQKRLRSSWNEMHQGLSRQHRIAILEEGMQYKQIGIPPEDAQFLETRRYQKQEIASLYRVPLHMVNDLADATFSNVEHMGIEFVKYSLQPWLIRFEKTMLMKLLAPNERKKYFIEFLVDGLLRGDSKTRYESYQIGRQNGWLSVNDIREMENLNPIEGGNVYLANAALMPIEQLGKSEGGGGNDNGATGV